MFKYRVVMFPEGDTFVNERECSRKEGLEALARYNENEAKLWAQGERTRNFYHEEK
jgi:hypothetical protein